jgi:hypothetical protein
MDCVSRAWQYQSNFKKKSTKLEKKAEQVLPGKQGGEWGEIEGGGQEGEKAQTMYSHMNKLMNKIIKK